MKAAGVINLNTSLTNLISAGMSSQHDQGTNGEMTTVKAMNDTATKAMNDTVSTQERQVIIVKKSDLQLAQAQDKDIMQKYEHM